MDNALFVLYNYLTFALLFAGCVGSIGGAPFRVSSLRMALVLALHVSLSLALAAHVAWRRLRWVPVEGEPLGCSRRSGSRIWSYDWRWSYGGATYTARDDDVSYILSPPAWTTLWVDPRDPSCLLPPSWVERIYFYLFLGGMSAYMILSIWRIVP